MFKKKSRNWCWRMYFFNSVHERQQKKHEAYYGYFSFKIYSQCEVFYINNVFSSTIIWMFQTSRGVTLAAFPASSGLCSSKISFDQGKCNTLTLSPNVLTSVQRFDFKLIVVTAQCALNSYHVFHVEKPPLLYFYSGEPRYRNMKKIITAIIHQI